MIACMPPRPVTTSPRTVTPAKRSAATVASTSSCSSRNRVPPSGRRRRVTEVLTCSPDAGLVEQQPNISALESGEARPGLHVDLEPKVHGVERDSLGHVIDDVAHRHGTHACFPSLGAIRWAYLADSSLSSSTVR